MRVLRRCLPAILTVALVACVRTSPATSTPAAPVATATTTPPPAPTDTPVPTVGPAVEGPEMAAGELLTAVAVAPGSQVRYGLLGPGLARSDDGGEDWQRVSALALPLPLVSPADADTLYAGNMRSCYKDEQEPNFRRSEDGGRTWVELAGGRGIRPVAALPGAAGGADTLYGISCQGLSVSTDAGETWELTGPTLGWDITGILPVTDGSLRLLAVLTSEGGQSHLAWFAQDGSLEQDLTDGLNFWGLGVLARAGDTLYVADSMGVWRQRGAAGDWERSSAGIEDVVLKADPLVEGLSEEDAERGFGLLALAPDPSDPQRLALGTVRGLYVSDDGGERWQQADAPSLAKVRINQIAWDAAAPNTLYAATPGGVYTVRLPR
jgi:hypothetical protein